MILIRMRVWLKQLRVTEIAMESTGVYWRRIPAAVGQPGSGQGAGRAQQRWA
jgi:hypothetical protein